MEQTKN